MQETSTIDHANDPAQLPPDGAPVLEAPALISQESPPPPVDEFLIEEEFDLSEMPLPAIFEEEVFGNQALMARRDLEVMQLQLAANKPFQNPEGDQLVKRIAVQLRYLAGIKKYHPSALALVSEMATHTAWLERQVRRDAAKARQEQAARS